MEPNDNTLFLEYDLTLILAARGAKEAFIFEQK
jgi:hypothetical protein